MTRQEPAASGVYNVAEAAAYLQMSESWLRQKCNDGTAHYSRLGKNLRFTQSDLDALMQHFHVDPLDLSSARTAARRRRAA